MPTTTNFGWTTPADTDLVKDGALAIRTLGNGIDTSLVDLKGGTTGQVLSKASNTDMDFTWVAADPLTILDAKGDLISATAADTPARLAVGTNGQVLTADSSTSTGLKWATPVSSTTFAGCRLKNSGNIAIANDTVTTVTFDQETFDTDGYHSTTTNTSRITIPSGKGGYYLFSAILPMSVGTAGDRVIELFKNGTRVDRVDFDWDTGAVTCLTLNAIEAGAVGDYFELKVYQDSGASQNLTPTATNGFNFSCAYLGA